MELQFKLGKAFAEKNSDAFKEALDLGANPNASDSTNITVYEISLATAGCAKFVELCLQHGSSVNYVSNTNSKAEVVSLSSKLMDVLSNVNQRLQKAAINYAADSRDVENFRVLLKHEGVQVDHTYNDLTPLNSLAKNVTTANASQVMECMQILLQYGASPNIPDGNEMTPLHYLLVQNQIDILQKKEFIELYLQQPQLHISRMLRDDFKILMPDQELPDAHDDRSQMTHEQLLHELHNDNDSQEMMQRYRDDDSFDYLAECIVYGHHRILSSILLTDIDINAKSKKYGKTYVEIATVYGNWEALGMLLQHERLQLDPNTELLDHVITRLESPVHAYKDYGKCLEALLKSKHVNINQMDSSGRTPLHYAALYNSENALTNLLHHGAHLGIMSKFGEFPIDDIDPEVLEQHFNDCITVKVKSRVDNDFQIVLDYTNLKRPRDETSRVPHNEMDPIVAMGNSVKLRHLLNHPVITTFISLKWKSISSLFYFYLIVSALLNIYVIIDVLLTFVASVDEKYVIVLDIAYLICIGICVTFEVIKWFVKRVLSESRFFNLAHIIMLILSNINRDPEIFYCRVIGAFTILSSAMRLTGLLGSLPLFSMSIHVKMLKKITSTFLKSCIPFSILVFSFGLSFYVLNIHNGVKKNIFEAILKAIVMATGEFDESSLEFNDNFLCNLFLIIFVIFISIVLMNLLTGLACDDTKEMRTLAEVNSQICFANIVCDYERFLTNSKGCLESLYIFFRQRLDTPHMVSTFPNKEDNTIRKRCALDDNYTEMRPLQENESEILLQIPEDPPIHNFDKTMIKEICDVINRKKTPFQSSD